MKLRRPLRRSQPETIIALIDVVFFLLVFFLLIGRMDATAPFDVTPPTAFGGTDMPGGGATISISAEGALALNGSALDKDGALRGIALLLENAPGLLIRVNAHRDSELRKVLPLVAEIEAMGASDIVLVVTPGAP